MTDFHEAVLLMRYSYKSSRGCPGVRIMTRYQKYTGCPALNSVSVFNTA